MDCELQSISIFHFDITILFDYFAEHFNIIFTKFSHQFAMQLNSYHLLFFRVEISCLQFAFLECILENSK